MKGSDVASQDMTLRYSATKTSWDATKFRRLVSPATGSPEPEPRTPEPYWLMPKERNVTPILAPDEIARWSSPECHAAGVEPYKCGYCFDPHVHPAQSAVAQNGVVLSASSGICLIIVGYAERAKLGLLVHLNRDDMLSECDADLISNPFAMFPQLAEGLIVQFVSSEEVWRQHPEQLRQAKERIVSTAPRAILHDLLVGGRRLAHSDEDVIGDMPPMSVDVFLDTTSGILEVIDEYGPPRHVPLLEQGATNTPDGLSGT